MGDGSLLFDLLIAFVELMSQSRCLLFKTCASKNETNQRCLVFRLLFVRQRSGVSILVEVVSRDSTGR